MRYIARGARVLCFAAAILASSEAESISVPEPKPAEPPSLAHDPSYVRQGAVTTMETCLTVASDLGANTLWYRVPDHYRVSSGQHQLAAWLAEHAHQFNRDSGFGTLLACAQIVAAWQASLPPQTPPTPHNEVSLAQDGRFEHGLTVVDLTLGNQNRAAIDSAPLIRLLSSPGLLPNASYGGILIKNALVNGPMLISNLRLNLPLTFVNVDFHGGQYPRGVFNNATPIKDRAISIVSSQFAESVQFSDVIVCGDVVVDDSQFHETFILNKVKQDSMSECSARGRYRRSAPPEIFWQIAPVAQIQHAPRPAFFLIQNSQFSQNLRITNTTTGTLKIDGNYISNTLISNSYFGSSLEILNNQIGTLYSEGRLLADIVAINYNKIAQDFTMYGPLSGRALANVTDMFQITSNKISGGLGFFDFPSGALPLTLDFQSNSVGNGSKICLPPAWPGRLDLSGSTFKGTLTVGLATAGNAEQLDQPYDAARPCGRLHDLENWTEQRQGTYCPPAGDTETVVNFTAADIRILQWHLPLNCWFRWAGYGLSYHLWRPYPDGPESPMAHLKAWRTTLHRPEPAPLDTMSRYLAEKGNYVDSRDIQIEAKRLNYAPDCAPERPLVACLYDLLAPSALVSSHAAAAVLEDGAQPAPPDLQERAASLLTRCPSKHYTCISLACRLWRGSGVRYRVYFRRDCILLLVLHMV